MVKGIWLLKRTVRGLEVTMFEVLSGLSWARKRMRPSMRNFEFLGGLLGSNESTAFSSMSLNRRLGGASK